MTEAWLSFSTAPDDGREVIAWREDAGVLIVQFVGPLDEYGQLDENEEPCWFTIHGEDLTADLPTHWIDLQGPDLKKEPS
ncbi:hypothetical protein [Denitrobaculum tricleocarpae]|uniref:DUF551 domain-containing protein n=1 Tax=Denitrobaculum tricleocarpae TaxID=2591009 RepID=A0A545TT08_9PROT|nr:hypothetical protein [Denitrobaculum tricleocarpae]TQV80359.1 hypothetical protein FKG95_09190 [Denitrobaculum tricleocarpae]